MKKKKKKNWKHRVWSWDKVYGQVKVTNFSFLIKNSKTGPGVVKNLYSVACAGCFEGGTKSKTLELQALG